MPPAVHLSLQNDKIKKVQNSQKYNPIFFKS